MAMKFFAAALLACACAASVSAQCNSMTSTRTPPSPGLSGVNTVTVTTASAAQFVFVQGSTQDLTIVAEGGAGLATTITDLNSNVDLSFAVTNFDAPAPGDGGAAAATQPSALLTVALATAAAAVAGWPGAAAAGCYGLPGVRAESACVARITFTLPPNRDIRFDLSGAQVVQPVCPAGSSFHPISGCAYFVSTYSKVWANPTNSAGCEAAFGSSITATSTAGNFIGFDQAHATIRWSEAYDGLQATVTNAFVGSYAQPANVTISRWQGQKFIAANVVAAGLTCDFAYFCASGNCTTGYDSGTYNCARFQYQASANVSAQCFHGQTWSGYPYGPALVCTTWCSTRDPATATCNAQVCPPGYCDAGQYALPAPCPNTFSAAPAAAGPVLLTALAAVAVALFGAKP